MENLKLKTLKKHNPLKNASGNNEYFEEQILDAMQEYAEIYHRKMCEGNQHSDTDKQQLKQPAVTTSYICTECGGDATIAMTGWKDNTGKNYYKKGERLCMRCHKARTGVGFFL